MDLAGVSLDPDTGEIRNGDLCVSLTPRQQAILMHLHRHAGHPVHVERLLVPLAPFRADNYGSPRLIYVFISALRAKLAAVGCEARIVTHYGRGYLLKL